MQREHADPAVGLVLVGFGPARRLAAIAARLGWQGRVLGDEPRDLYRRLGIGRARWWRVYSPRTVLTYARATRHGWRPTRPVEDARQLGGDAVVADGVVVAVWRPRSPDDRPSATEVLAEASRAAAT